MKALARFVTLATAIALLSTGTPSWGGPPNPTGSDENANTAGGSNALQFVIAPGACGTAGGCANTAFGAGALQANTIGSNNTAVGFGTLFGSTGSDNSACGANALGSNTTGSLNTAGGSGALASNTLGNENTASGLSALASNTTGSLNTANGVLALSQNVSGVENTAVGAKALKKSTGTKNIGIGYQAGVTLTTGNNNIYIGNQGAGSESQTIRIGTAQTSTFVAGIAGANVSGASVEIDTSTGQLGVTGFSSARYKRDIAPMGKRSEAVLHLHPVTFAYRDDGRGLTHYGLVAEEVETVYPELVTHTPAGEAQAVRYQELIPMLLNELQRQRQEIEQALQAVQRQQRELADLRARVGQARGAEAETVR